MTYHRRPFFMLPQGWRELDDVMQLSPSGQLFLIVIVENCLARQNHGVMTLRQLRALARTLPTGHRQLAELIDAKMLLECDPEDPKTSWVWGSSAAGLSRGSRAVVAPLSQDGRESVASLSRDGRESVAPLSSDGRIFLLAQREFWLKTAGQSAENEPSRAPAQAPARTREEKKRIEADNRPPSAARFSASRDAPRGGAARPATVGDQGTGGDTVAKPPPSEIVAPWDPDLEEGPRYTKDEAMAMMREMIKKSTRYTGRIPKGMNKGAPELYPVPPPQPPDDSGWDPKTNGYRK